MAVTFEPDDFEAWRVHPVTRAVLDAHAKLASRIAGEWMAFSWTGGGCDEKLLIELRTRADAYQAIGDLTYERLKELLSDG